jgi:hypothetical protein
MGKAVNKKALKSMRAFYKRSLELNKTYNKYRDLKKFPTYYTRGCEKMYARIRKFFDFDIFTEEKFGKTIPEGATLATTEIKTTVGVVKKRKRKNNVFSVLIVKKAEIYFWLEDNKDTDEFPYIGLHLILNFYGEKDNFRFTIAKSQEGSKYVLPTIIDPLTFSISSKENILTFPLKTEYDKIICFCQGIIETINNGLIKKKLISNII